MEQNQVNVLKKDKDTTLNCDICKHKIDLNKPFCELLQYEKRHVVFDSKFYHIVCYVDKIRGGKDTRALMEQAKILMEHTRRELEKLKHGNN